MKGRALRIIYGILALTALWWVASLIIGPALVPAPPAVIGQFIKLTADGSLPSHALASLLRLFGGIGAAVLAGLPIGIVLGVNAAADRSLSPLLYLLYPLPKIAFLPLFMLLFGLGDLSKVILVFAVMIFQISLAVRDSMKAIPPEYHRAAFSLGLTKRRRLWKMYLPAAMPGLFSALRVSVGIGMAVLFFAENYATEYGLGYFVMNSWIMADYRMMFAGILALGITAAALLALLDRLEILICPWISRSGTFA